MDTSYRPGERGPAANPGAGRRASDRRRRWRVIVITLGAVAAQILIGIVDLATGGYAFSLFYVLPILAVAWLHGRGPGVITALAAAASWFFDEYHIRGVDFLPLVIWNSLSRCGIFLIIALTVARLRSQGQSVTEMNRKLSLHLQEETRAARTDALTELPNSRALLEHLAERVGSSRSDPLAIAYLDLDNFKCINDRFGHAVGDDILRRVAGILRESIRLQDLAARIGGDEFVIVFEAVDRQALDAIARRILTRVGELELEFPNCAFGATAGIVFSNRPPADAEDLLRRADDIMYAVKEEGKASYRIVTS
ncbi:MAG TPA: diguanylate cyclase [Thermoanaerobaculia bacterium]|nr:diguanylate cyclase [Thermoanaerobaculia bacterium]